MITAVGQLSIRSLFSVVRVVLGQGKPHCRQCRSRAASCPGLTASQHLKNRSVKTALTVSMQPLAANCKAYTAGFCQLLFRTLNRIIYAPRQVCTVHNTVEGQELEGMAAL